MPDTSGLPPLDNTKTDPQPTSSGMPAPINIDLGLGPSSKDVMIGAFVNYLVGSLKRSPNNAGLAGWGLFGGLLFGAAIGSIALIGKSFLTVMYIAPLAALSLICFVLCFVVAAKK